MYLSSLSLWTLVQWMRHSAHFVKYFSYLQSSKCSQTGKLEKSKRRSNLSGSRELYPYFRQNLNVMTKTICQFERKLSFKDELSDVKCNWNWSPQSNIFIHCTRRIRNGIKRTRLQLIMQSVECNKLKISLIHEKGELKGAMLGKVLFSPFLHPFLFGFKSNRIQWYMVTQQDFTSCLSAFSSVSTTETHL